MRKQNTKTARSEIYKRQIHWRRSFFKQDELLANEETRRRRFLRAP
jgi:hypothetical protein